MAVETDNPQILRLIADKQLQISCVRNQPFLGSDIYYERGPDGWKILLYPRVWQTHTGDHLILLALASILRREKPWFAFPAVSEMESKIELFLKPSKESAELFRGELWGFYNSFCQAFELELLLTQAYMTPTELRSLVDYLSSTCVTVQVGTQFLASMAVLRRSGGDVTLLHEELVKRKRYEMLKVVDCFEKAIRHGGFQFSDMEQVFECFFSKAQSPDDLAKQISQVQTKVLGPRTLESLEYDVAISFAGEDRLLARELAARLTANGYRAFFDEYERANLWGKDLYSHLTDVYGRRARYCVMLVSRNYALKQWTNLERKAAQAKALQENSEYILPVRIDDTDLPGLLPTVGYLHLRELTIEQVAATLIEKLEARL